MSSKRSITTTQTRDDGDDDGASSGLQDVIALHLIGVATILVGMVFRDPFAHFLRNVGALLLIVACLFALAGPIEESATSWFLPVYCIVLMAVSFIYAYAFSNLLFFYGGLAMTALALGTFGWHTYTALKRAPEWQGIDSFLLALAFLGVATAISAVKAGISQRLIALFPKPRPPTNGPID